MKKCLILAAMLIVSMLFAFADTHLGRTENNVTDSSFIVQGYYKGEHETASVKLQFKDINNQTIIHSGQSTEGTKVNVSDSHIGSNTGTIFTWSMTGNFRNTTKLKFTFSTLQAEVNGTYYRPAYTLKMIINATKKNSSTGNTMTDTFYSTATATQVVGGGTVTGTKDTQNEEFSGAATVFYEGNTSDRNTTWYRSGTCTLNIADYEQTIPGSYHYVCWVIAEYSIE